MSRLRTDFEQSFLANKYFLSHMTATHSRAGKKEEQSVHAGGERSSTEYWQGLHDTIRITIQGS